MVILYDGVMLICLVHMPKQINTYASIMGALFQTCERPQTATTHKHSTLLCTGITKDAGFKRCSGRTNSTEEGQPPCSLLERSNPPGRRCESNDNAGTPEV